MSRDGADLPEVTLAAIRDRVQELLGAAPKPSAQTRAALNLLLRRPTTTAPVPRKRSTAA